MCFYLQSLLSITLFQCCIYVCYPPIKTSYLLTYLPLESYFYRRTHVCYFSLSSLNDSSHHGSHHHHHHRHHHRQSLINFVDNGVVRVVVWSDSVQGGAVPPRSRCWGFRQHAGGYRPRKVGEATAFYELASNAFR